MSACFYAVSHELYDQSSLALQFSSKAANILQHSICPLKWPTAFAAGIEVATS